ncbi:leukotriene B4 receptor 1-like [Ictalurus furcatus]|uniref:leukotriene B4 receptor 1-like n=1 Tax=Ictalurus furcatus TaxID=66913 RepID=UPI002350AA1B|nr:leukotriene B4 receptor 1-like [Ictalurus furcatus]
MFTQPSRGTTVNSTLKQSVYSWLYHCLTMRYLNFSVNQTSESDFLITNGTVGYKQVGAAVFLSMCCLVGLPSNIAVIITIARQWNRRMSFTLKLMLNLAISDSLVLTLAPFGVSGLLYGWTFGLWSCKILMYLVYCAMYASVLTVTLMAAHHYHTIKSKVADLSALERLQKVRRHLLLIGLWSLATVFALPILFIQNVQFKRGSSRCQRTITSHSGKVTVLVLEVLFGYVLPFTIIAASYCWICKTQLQGGKNIRERRQRMRRLVISIVTAFFLFWTPVHVINMIDIATTLTKASSPAVYTQLKLIRRATGDLSKTVCVLNCCVNPFLYAIASGIFRKKRHHQETENNTDITVTN